MSHRILAASSRAVDVQIAVTADMMGGRMIVRRHGGLRMIAAMLMSWA